MMMKRIMIPFLLVVLTAANALSQEGTLRTFSLDPTVISAVRDQIRSGEFGPAVRSLRNNADKALGQEPLSVMDKKQTPPSGDKHDYMSIAPYWWPDPKKTDGLPYIRRDGEVNPERADFPDRDNIRSLVSSVYTLSIAYYFTQYEPYAKHAALMLRTWFLDPETRMNPNVNYGQAIKGITKGRGAGLIETSWFRNIVDALGLIDSSTSWTDNDTREMKRWFGEYFAWLRSSETGLDEADSKNNHGTWYDVQCASIALYLGMTDTAKAILTEAKSKRISPQIEPDGRMPLELVRTKALGYTTMNLEAFCTLASLGQRVGVDLWSFTTEDGRSIKLACDWALPFWNGEKKWEYKQIIDFDEGESYPVILMMAKQYGGKYLAASKRIPKHDRTRLLFGVRSESEVK